MNTNNKTFSIVNPNVLKILKGPLKEFYKKIVSNDTVNGTVEILEFSDWFDPSYEFIDYFDIKKASRKYIENEKNWYMSLDRSIKGHPGIESNKIWQYCASKDEKQEVNSQYGWIVFSPENGVNSKNQYECCLEHLVNDINTRQAGMIYTRPTIHAEYCENGKHDFICTTEVWVHIRNNRLIYSVNMRSNDFFTGFVNDWAWHYFIYHKLMNDLHERGIDVELGNIYWHASSFHVYERNFEDIINIYNRYQLELKNKCHHIYKITNTNNGKAYIGKHYGSIYDEYMGSSTIINKDKKGLKEKFGSCYKIEFNKKYIKEILEICEPNQIDIAEKNWIINENSFYPNGMNIDTGGSGGDRITRNPNKEQIINNIREGLLRRDEQHPEIRKLVGEKIKGANNGRWKGGVSQPKPVYKPMNDIIIETPELCKLFKQMWNCSFITLKEINKYFGISKASKVAAKLNLGPKNVFIRSYLDTNTNIIYNSLKPLKKIYNFKNSNQLPYFIKEIQLGDMFDLEFSKHIKEKYIKNIEATDGYKTQSTKDNTKNTNFVDRNKRNVPDMYGEKNGNYRNGKYMQNR